MMYLEDHVYLLLPRPQLGVWLRVALVTLSGSISTCVEEIWAPRYPPGAEFNSSSKTSPPPFVSRAEPHWDKSDKEGTSGLALGHSPRCKSGQMPDVGQEEWGWGLPGPLRGALGEGACCPATGGRVCTGRWETRRVLLLGTERPQATLLTVPGGPLPSVARERGWLAPWRRRTCS